LKSTGELITNLVAEVETVKKRGRKNRPTPRKTGGRKILAPDHLKGNGGGPKTGGVPLRVNKKKKKKNRRVQYGHQDLKRKRKPGQMARPESVAGSDYCPFSGMAGRDT